MQVPQSSTSSVFPTGVSRIAYYYYFGVHSHINSLAQEQLPSAPPSLDEIDVTRHREITSKAVSAILLLVLKWFKVSRGCLFHF